MSHIENHLQEIGKGLDYYSLKYKNFIVLGDFNAEMSNPHISEFCEFFIISKTLLRDLHVTKTYKSASIDHILTNHARCFQHSDICEMGLSDFHKLTFTVLKTLKAKQKPRIIRVVWFVQSS